MSRTHAGVLDNDCHDVFIKCIEAELKSGSNGFSDTCPYKTIVPVMKQGIQMTMMFASSLGGDGHPPASKKSLKSLKTRQSKTDGTSSKPKTRRPGKNEL